MENDPFSKLIQDPSLRQMRIETTSIYPRSINDSEQGGSASWIFPSKGTLSNDTRLVLPAVCARKEYQYPINCGLWSLIEKATFSTSNGSVFGEVSKAGEIYHWLNLTTDPEKNLNVMGPLSGINYNFETGSGSKLTNDASGMENLAGQYRLTCEDYKEKKPSSTRAGRLNCRPNCVDGQSPAFLLETDPDLTPQLSLQLSQLFPALFADGSFELPLFVITDSLILDIQFTKCGALGSSDRAIYLPELADPSQASSITCAAAAQVGACAAKAGQKDQILEDGSGDGSGLRLLVDFDDDAAGTMLNVRVLDGGKGYVEEDDVTFTAVADYDVNKTRTTTALNTNLVVTPGCKMEDWSSDANFRVPSSYAGADFVEGNEYLVKNPTNSNQDFKIKAVSVNSGGGLVECTLADKQTNDNLCIPRTTSGLVVMKTDGTTDSGARLMINVSVATLFGKVTGAVPNGSVCSTADGNKVAWVTELTDEFITEVVMEKGTLEAGDVFVLTTGNSFTVNTVNLQPVYLTGAKTGANFAIGDLLFDADPSTKGALVLTVNSGGVPDLVYSLAADLAPGDVLKKMKADETLDDDNYMTIATVVDTYLNVTTTVAGDVSVGYKMKTDGASSTIFVEKTVNRVVTQIIHYDGDVPDEGDVYFPVGGDDAPMTDGDDFLTIATVGAAATIPHGSTSKIPLPQLGLDPIYNFDDVSGQKIKIVTDKCFIITDLIFRFDGTEELIAKAVMGKGLPHVYTQFENSTFTLPTEPDSEVSKWGDKQTLQTNRLIGLSNNVVRNIMFMIYNSGKYSRPQLPYYKQPKVNPLLNKYHSRCSLAENGLRYNFEINSLPHYNSGPIESEFRAFRELCKCKGNMYLNKALYSAWNNCRQLDNSSGALSDAAPSLQPGFVELELDANGARVATPKYQINERKAGMSNQGYYGVNQAVLRGMNNYHGVSFKLHNNTAALGNGVAVGNQSASIDLYQDATYDSNYSGSCTLSVHSEVERSLIIMGGQIHVSTASF
tara:strand:- start:7791 stop:10814 length:3024 start_codon:yes stop_codon:yes gene_type:complete